MNDNRQHFRMIVCALLAGALCAATVSLGQESSSEPAGVLHGLEAAKFAALQRDDKPALADMLDDSLMWMDANGSLRNKADYLAAWHGTAQLLKIKPEVMKVLMFGDVALVVGIYEESGLRAGRPYRQRCRFIDTWTLKNGKWVCVAAAETPVIA